MLKCHPAKLPLTTIEKNVADGWPKMLWRPLLTEQTPSTQMFVRKYVPPPSKLSKCQMLNKNRVANDWMDLNGRMSGKVSWVNGERTPTKICKAGKPCGPLQLVGQKLYSSAFKCEEDSLHLHTLSHWYVQQSLLRFQPQHDQKHNTQATSSTAQGWIPLSLRDFERRTTCSTQLRPSDLLLPQNLWILNPSGENVPHTNPFPFVFPETRFPEKQQKRNLKKYAHLACPKPEKAAKREGGKVKQADSPMPMQHMHQQQKAPRSKPGLPGLKQLKQQGKQKGKRDSAELVGHAHSRQRATSFLNDSKTQRAQLHAIATFFWGTSAVHHTCAVCAWHNSLKSQPVPLACIV